MMAIRNTVMLCESLTPEQARAFCKEQNGWILEQKVDGVRGFIQDGKLYDRRGVEITERFPEFIGIGTMQGIFDGEIICKSNDFGDIQSRMHLKDRFLRKLMQEKNPALFVLFDVLEDAKDMRTLKQRKERLRGLMDEGKLPSWVMVLPWEDAEKFDAMWAKVEQNGWEGLVLKDGASVYERKRSQSWLKAKSFSETQADFVKYEEHPRGITIETADGRRVVVNGAMAPVVKHELIRNGKVRCDILFMKSALEGSDAWRFASFRGVSEVAK